MIYHNHDDYPEYPGFDYSSLDFALEPLEERPLDFEDGYAGRRREAERQWREDAKKK